MTQTVKSVVRTLLAALLMTTMVVAVQPPAQAATRTVVSGTISDAHGVGVPRARVTLFVADRPTKAAATARAGADGSYRLPPVPSGTYLLRATDPSLASAATWWPEASNSFAAGTLSVAGSGVVVDLQLIPGLAISGTTRYQGVPQSRVKVCVLAPDIPCALSGPDGRYTVRGIAPDYYRLTAEPTRHGKPYVRTWYPEYTDGQSVISPVESIDAESAARPWDFALATQPTVTGHVVNDMGAPVAGAKVCVAGASTCTRAARDGGFVLKAEVPLRGSLELSARARGHYAGSVSTSDSTGVVIPLQRIVPVKAAKPVISGDAVVGGTLTATPGTWGPSQVQLSYRWYRNGHRIKHATGETYVLTAADKGKRIRVQVTGKLPGVRSVARLSQRTAAVSLP